MFRQIFFLRVPYIATKNAQMGKDTKYYSTWNFNLPQISAIVKKEN